MKKGVKKLFAVTSAITMLGCSAGALAACGDNKKPNGGDIRSQTLVIASDGEFSEKFSPLFASSAYDQNVVGYTQLGIIAADRNGDYVLDGMDKPAVRSYNGKDYEYSTPGKLEVDTATSQDTTTYTITIRKDLKYSDGSAITIDDYLFNFYCLVDTSYAGSATLGGLDIVGLADYQTNGQQAVANENFAKLENAFTNKIGAKYFEKDGELEGVIDLDAYVTGGVIDEGERALAEKALGWAPQTSGWEWVVDTTVSFGASLDEVLAAYEVDTLPEVWAAMYGVDLTGATTEEEQWAKVNPVIAFDELANSEYFGSYATGLKNFIMAEAAENATEEVKFVSGVTRINDYSMSIKVNGGDNSTNQSNFGSLTPMKISYYGNGNYNYADGNFGFEKGKMAETVDTSAKTRNPGPSCAGAYQFVKYENGVVYLQANQYYYSGKPNIPYIELRYVSIDEIPSAINSGTVDIGTVNYSKQTIEEVKAYSNYDFVVTPFLGYGYLGIQADRVRVGADSASDASKNLRKAYATLFAAYRSYTVDSYYGSTANVIEYPISDTSWAAPKPTDQGYEVAYSKKVDGSPIFTASMTTEQRQAAALDAAIGYFEAAGFTRTDGKFTDVPTYTVYIGEAETHPSFAMINKVKEALDTIGVRLEINDVTSTALFAAMEGLTADMFVAAWQATIDPDLTQTYRSTSYKNNPGYTSGTNHYGIQDTALDKLIDDARANTDRVTRKEQIKDAMDIIMDWGVEVPVYQRQEAAMYSTARIDESSMTQDVTAYYGWAAELDKLKKK